MIPESLDEHGVRPIQLLERAGCLGPHTTVIHATHANGEEFDLLAATGACVCACLMTEANLGDGFASVERLCTRTIGMCIARSTTCASTCSSRSCASSRNCTPPGRKAQRDLVRVAALVRVGRGRGRARAPRPPRGRTRGSIFASRSSTASTRATSSRRSSSAARGCVRLGTRSDSAAANAAASGILAGVDPRTRIHDLRKGSGRRDLNPRPLGPQPSALPGYATPRGERTVYLRCESRL